MEVWVLYDLDECGQIIDIDAVTADAGIAEMWQRECTLYRAKKFKTEKAPEYVSDVFSINFDCSTEQEQ
jgi:hypothetical protein